MRTFVSRGVSAGIQSVTSGLWGNFVGKVSPITNVVDAVGSGVASWIGETGYITADKITDMLMGN